MFQCTTDELEFLEYQDPSERTNSEKSRLLIVDSHPAYLLGICRRVLSDEGHHVEAVCSAAAAIARINLQMPDLIVLDAHLDDGSGLDFQAELGRSNPAVPVIFSSSSTRAEVAIRAMKQGAYDFVLKPIEDSQLERVLREALETSNRVSPAPAPSFPSTDVDDLVTGGSVAMRDVYKAIGRVAGQDVNVLITGESGTGKELVARAIHRHSARANQPFLALNCAAIPENLLESELFGHEKGAFSGADRRRIGKFEQYSGGTILLDEIGDMPLSLQAKILRLLQEQAFERVGGNETIQTNVRLIASTHRNLKAWSAEDKFRADLYYRLSVFTIELPPLRARSEDLETLVRYFLARYSREMGRQTTEIAPAAMDRLRRYAWPGNLRELQSVIRQALLRATGQVLLPAFLPELSRSTPSKNESQSSQNGDFNLDAFLEERLTTDAGDLYAEIHRELDQHALARVLTFTRGNQHLASRVLGIARQTLRMKLRESGVQISQSVQTAHRLGAVPPVRSITGGRPFRREALHVGAVSG